MVDVALYEAVFTMMESMVPEFDMTGFVRERSRQALPGIVPSNTYLTRDGKYVMIGANSDSIFKRLMTAIGREDLADDPALADNAGRVPRTEELDAAIGDWTAAHDLDAVLAVLDAAEVPAGKIYNVADIVARPAVPGARHDRAAHAAGRQAGEDARHRAEALRDAGRDQMGRARSSARIPRKCCARMATPPGTWPACARPASSTGNSGQSRNTSSPCPGSGIFRLRPELRVCR